MCHGRQNGLLTSRATSHRLRPMSFHSADFISASWRRERARSCQISRHNNNRRSVVIRADSTCFPVLFRRCDILKDEPRFALVGKREGFLAG